MYRRGNRHRQSKAHQRMSDRQAIDIAVTVKEQRGNDARDSGRDEQHRIRQVRHKKQQGACQHCFPLVAEYLLKADKEERLQDELLAKRPDRVEDAAQREIGQAAFDM